MSQKLPDCLRAFCRSYAQPQNTSSTAETKAQPPGHPPVGYIHRGQAKQAERNMASGLALDLLSIFFWHESRLINI